MIIIVKSYSNYVEVNYMIMLHDFYLSCNKFLTFYFYPYLFDLPHFPNRPSTNVEKILLTSTIVGLCRSCSNYLKLVYL